MIPFLSYFFSCHFRCIWSMLPVFSGVRVAHLLLLLCTVCIIWLFYVFCCVCFLCPWITFFKLYSLNYSFPHSYFRYCHLFWLFCCCFSSPSFHGMFTKMLHYKVIIIVFHRFFFKSCVYYVSLHTLKCICCGNGRKFCGFTIIL